jgi:hypothetical protein
MARDMSEPTTPTPDDERPTQPYGLMPRHTAYDFSGFAADDLDEEAAS